jgi:hypothetical protein
VSVAVAPWTDTDAATAPPGPASEIAAAVLAASMASLNVTITAASACTPTASAAGSCDTIHGRTRSGGGTVVKLHDTGAASGFPARSLAPVVTVAVYVVSQARGLHGTKVTLVGTYVTGPGIRPPAGSLTTTVVSFRDDGSIGSLNIAVTTAPSGERSVAPAAGQVERTVGATVSDGGGGELPPPEQPESVNPAQERAPNRRRRRPERNGFPRCRLDRGPLYPIRDPGDRESFRQIPRSTESSGACWCVRRPVAWSNGGTPGRL